MVKAAGLALAGGVSLGLAYLWNMQFPFNKNLWTSSFVLWTTGWSLLLLSVFYLLIDVWQIRGWAFFFVVIGANAITIYVGQHIIDFEGLAKVAVSHHMHEMLHEAGGLFLKWLFLFLYKQRIFFEGLIVSDAAEKTNAVKKNSILELIKSIVVIPLVIALVVGVGWGLVRVASARQRDSGKPAPRPAEKGADGAYTLEIPFAQVTGEIHYGGRKHPELENWKHAGESVIWRFEIDRPGQYAVELDCACDAANAGSVVSITVEGTKLEATIPNTGGWKTFKPVRAGTVKIGQPGWRELHIVPVSIAHDTVTILRSAYLCRSGVPLDRRR